MVSIFLFGKDVKDQTTQMLVVKDDGTVVEETQTSFKALETAMNTAWQALLGRVLFGERQFTKMVQISFQNWDRLCSLIDNFVKQQMK